MCDSPTTRNLGNFRRIVQIPSASKSKLEFAYAKRGLCGRFAPGMARSLFEIGINSQLQTTLSIPYFSEVYTSLQASPNPLSERNTSCRQTYNQPYLTTNQGIFCLVVRVLFRFSISKHRHVLSLLCQGRSELCVFVRGCGLHHQGRECKHRARKRR